MAYNLDLFGKKMMQIRQNLCLTKNRICELTGIDPVTIRRIEKGKVVPRLDTLEILSPIFKQDLSELLLKYRLDDFSTFYEIKNVLETKLDKGEFYTLHLELKSLENLLTSTNNPYYKMLIKQLVLFTKAIILYENSDNDKSLKTLINAIKITTPLFALKTYDSFVYSSMEIRILMNIAFILNRLNNKEKYLEVIEFCINSVDPDEEIYHKLCHNLAGAYIRNKDFTMALKYFDLGIKSCRENRNLNGLPLLYYGKGVAEYRLNKEAYIESLKTSIYLCKAFGQAKLENTIINNCKEFLGMDLYIRLSEIFE